MEKETELKIIGGLLGLWASVRIGSAILSIPGYVNLSSTMIAGNFAIGLILAVGSIGILMRKKIGYYAGLTGIGILLLLNLYYLVTRGISSIISIILVTAIGFYLYTGREQSH